VKDPSGLILFAELASGQGCAGNEWPSICIGPYISDGGANGNLYQIDSKAPAPNPGAGSGFNEGQQLYKRHSNRFNYLFTDNHAAALKIEQTIGGGTLTAPLGMWTMTPGD